MIIWYKCKNYFYKENRNGFAYYNCLNENELCPQGYNYYIENSKECLEECPTDNTYYYQSVGNGLIICYPNTCPEEKNIIEGTKECRNNVPSNYKYYMEDENEIKTWHLNSSPSDKKYMKKESEGDLIFYRCTDGCINDNPDNPNNIEYK